ncbi:uncharacterized protein LTR77_004172 [Saxophila tyrrhenica]|uniref:Uncharacterized protein n=1 Tax=Saxophila tyrrhenica TaxID=1690608 RepID=A0AAV9PG81_9PEZI|nr:hypothetical protein LTR77_004172 [Saxophila tyrrhenica]
MTNPQPTNPNTPRHRPFPFLSLPPDLRNQIYPLIFSPSLLPTGQTLPLLTAAAVHLRPSLSQVNRQLRNETLQLYHDWTAPFWRHNTFTIRLGSNDRSSVDRFRLRHYKGSDELSHLQTLCGSGFVLRNLHIHLAALLKQSTPFQLRQHKFEHELPSLCIQIQLRIRERRDASGWSFVLRRPGGNVLPRSDVVAITAGGLVGGGEEGAGMYERGGYGAVFGGC